MSASEGKQFEKDFEESCVKTQFYYLRLIDGAKWVQGAGASFTPENKCDCILFTQPFFWMLELKSNGSGSISFFPFDDEDGAPWTKPTGFKGDRDIKAHQVKDILSGVDSVGVIGGFLLNFRERNLKTKTHTAGTYFVHIHDFINFAKESGKSSINKEDAERIGVEVPHRLKKRYYSYDIKEFIDEAIVKYIKSGYVSIEQISTLHEWLGFLTTVLVVDGGVNNDRTG